MHNLKKIKKIKFIVDNIKLSNIIDYNILNAVTEKKISKLISRELVVAANQQ